MAIFFRQSRICGGQLTEGKVKNGAVVLAW